MDIKIPYYRDAKKQTSHCKPLIESSLLPTEIRNHFHRHHSLMSYKSQRSLPERSKPPANPKSNIAHNQFLRYADEAHLLAQRCNMNIRIHDENEVGIIQLTGDILLLKSDDELPLSDVLKNLFNHAQEILFSTFEDHDEILISLLFLFPLYDQITIKE